MGEILNKILDNPDIFYYILVTELRQQNEEIKKLMDELGPFYTKY
jgi:hypothetical protein